jgi:hypothetical protein
MSDKQQTAVEWLVKELNQKIDFIPLDKWDMIMDIIQQAKEMEKKQIAKAFDDGDYNYHYSRKTGNDFEDGQEYFNEIYK